MPGDAIAIAHGGRVPVATPLVSTTEPGSALAHFDFTRSESPLYRRTCQDHNL